MSAEMNTDLKFQLASNGYLEDRIARYFRCAGNEDILYQRPLASNIVDWDFDGQWLRDVLQMDKVDFNALRNQVQPSPIPPLPADQEVWAESLMTHDDDELQRKVHYLNRPDAMTKEERLRNRWASNLINRWLSLCDSGHLKVKDYSEQHYATMIMGYLVDGLLDRVEDMDLRR